MFGTAALVFAPWLSEEDLLGRPASMIPFAGSAVQCSARPDPATQRLRFAPVCEHNSVPPVVHLFASRGPATVIWGIVAIVICPLYAIFRTRFFAHVRKEVIKRMKPPFANTDTSTAVVVVLFMVEIIAALLHRLPCLIYWRLCATRSQAMRVPKTTATTPGFAPAQVHAKNDPFGSAVTTAKPQRGTASSSYVLQSKPLAEALTCEVLEVGSRRERYSLVFHRHLLLGKVLQSHQKYTRMLSPCQGFLL